MQKSIVWIVILLIVIGGGFFLFRQFSPSSNTPSTSAPNKTQPASSTPTPGSTNQSFTVTADDSSSDLTTINVKKGTTVSIKFTVKSDNVYHGGLDFRSSQISTGPISPGSSKTISFVADSSFTFTPYWPSSNVAKPYTISVVVQ